MIPKFDLTDIPETWWVRLNDTFVEELDQLNRPYKYGLSRKRITRYWEAGELWKRTLDKMTEEEVTEYKRRHSFFEKVWGRHRWKDYHFDKDDPRRYVDTGPWVTKEDLEVLREGIDIDDENLNKAITGFRLGKFSDNVREMRFKQLPIVPDEWWAWMFGFYFGAGNMYLYEREGPHTRKGGIESVYIRIRVQDPLIPRFLSIANHLGMHAVNYQIGEKFRGEGKMTGLGVGQREHIVFGWPEFLVLEKFGLPTEIFEVENRKEYRLAASGYKPKIPDWIHSNDEYMRYFIEGYMATGKCQSTVSVAEQPFGRTMPHQDVRLIGVGYPETHIKKFMQQIHLWFTKHGIIPGFRDDPVKAKDRFRYILHLSSKASSMFLLNNFELDQPSLKARIYIKTESDEDPVLYEVLRRYGNPENVVLGCLLEQPMTVEEIVYDLRMYPEAAAESLKKLIQGNLVVQDGDHYRYEPKKFIEATIHEYQELAEEKRQRMAMYSEQLLYQCNTCRQVYIIRHDFCTVCGEDVNPTKRGTVLKRLNSKSRYDILLSKKLEAAT